jgi:hypothetical protein
MYSKNERTVYEYCSICDCMYDLKGRMQHLRTRKHSKQIIKLNLEDSYIPVEHYSLTLEGEREINSD